MRRLHSNRAAFFKNMLPFLFFVALVFALSFPLPGTKVLSPVVGLQTLQLPHASVAHIVLNWSGTHML